MAVLMRSAIVIPLSEWDFIKTKLAVNKNLWRILDPLGGVALGIGINIIYVDWCNLKEGLLFGLVGFLILVISHLKENDSLLTRCKQVLEQISLIEKRYSLGADDNMTAMNPADNTTNKIEEIK